MGTSLAERKVAGLASREDVNETFRRIKEMMPGAADAPDSVVKAAAQIVATYELNPFNGEVYIMSTGKTKNDRTGQWEDVYQTYVGVKGMRKSARRQAEFMTDFEDMTPDEVQSRRRSEYDPDDVGVRCILYRLDLAMKCKAIGIPYRPIIAEGFWRKKSRYSKYDKAWKEDNVPETWTPQMVAKKRAEVNAIKEAFDLTFNVADPADTIEAETWEVMGNHLDSHDRDNAMLEQRESVEIDDDGVMLWAEDKRPIKRAQEVKPPQSDADAEWDDIPGTGASAPQADGRPDWKSPVDAQNWAVENGFVENIHAARNSWKKAVESALGSATFKPEQMNEALDAFYQHQMSKNGVPA